WKKIRPHLNFFRIHLAVFTFVPLIVACIFYASNGSATGNANSANTGTQRVTFVDSLFVCFSAMSVTGLVTINISACNTFQQVLLFLLFLAGDYSVVSFFMVLVRKRYFKQHCYQLLKNDHFHRTNTLMPPAAGVLDRFASLRQRAAAIARRKNLNKGLISPPLDPRPARTPTTEKPPAFRLDELDARLAGITAAANVKQNHEFNETTLRGSVGDHTDSEDVNRDGTAVRFTDSPLAASFIESTRGRNMFPRRLTQEEGYHARRRVRETARSMTMSTGRGPSTSPHRAMLNLHPNNQHYYHTPVIPPRLPQHPVAAPHDPLHAGYGGFPSPWKLLVKTFLPQKTRKTLERKLTQPVRSHTLLTHDPLPELKRYDRYGEVSNDLESEEKGWSLSTQVSKWMPEMLSALVVGRNSRFFTEELDDEDLERLGGVEYRALRLLSIFVPAYITLCQIIPFAILAIYFSQVHSYDSAYQAQTGVQARTVNKTWASLFAAVSAYTGCGMTLTDQGLAPFASCYILIYVIALVMLAGNHALPMTLRLFIWIGTKIWRKGETNETLHFLLDHPRRHQTWYLTLALATFTAIELFGYLVLNIGLPILKDISPFQRFSDAVIQSLSVRGSGFGVVSVSSMAPSVLYVVLMYVAIYPIAMSVRSTNVYEERALGVYHASDPELTSEDEPAFQGARGEVFSKYLKWHMRRQLAFDIWPLALAVFLVLIVERGKLLDPERQPWFSIFRVIFECTSAYSTIGLSLGTPNNNYSFSGELSTLSKLIMIVLLLRGRHRGLPVAIDRAILLPKEYARI
ncbi:hypothetical protein TREMEDRAFT_11924, partial [Tremella mesenterica DSM 1558]|uniref:uncharacterized protein n=1 Tax=Tremella mesenterica (strain ATCC 24925 / CBS 8224 / DSM 1558 / NBRC 9311 / NRRL Y-6157 / RJB 2259-6 / UBC 559-6) TaxID=578456 RepID=UPI0003F493FB